MHYTIGFTALAIFGRLSSVALGAVTVEQIAVAIQDVPNSINQADAYLKDFNAVDAALDANQIATNDNGIASQIESIQNSLVGATGLTANDGGNRIIEAVDPFTDTVVTYFGDLKDIAGDFLVPDDKSEIKDSADSIRDGADSLIDTFTNIYEGLAVDAEFPPREEYIDNATDDLDDA